MIFRAQLFSSPSFNALAIGMAMLLLAGCGKTPEATTATVAKKKAPASNDAATNVVTNGADATLAVKSVFTVDPEKVPDPFYPHLKPKQQAQTGGQVSTTNQVGIAPPPQTQTPTLVVQQIIGSGARRVALVNDQVLEPGRSAFVTVAGGQRWKVFCVRVEADAVIVRVEGQGGGKEFELPAPKRSGR